MSTPNENREWLLLCKQSTRTLLARRDGPHAPTDRERLDEILENQLAILQALADKT